MGLTIKIEKEWSVSSKSEMIGRGGELINMIGLWGINIEVDIIKPYVYSQGPVGKVINKEQYDDSRYWELFFLQ